MRYYTFTIAGCPIQLSEDAAELIWIPPLKEYLSEVADEKNHDAILNINTDDVALAIKELRLSTSMGGVPLMGIMGEALPFRRKLLFHGAAVSFEGKGYVFAAPSGTGKSTHIMLWKRYLGDSVKVICGDKPIIHVSATDDEYATVFGSPWTGKEGWHSNISAKLAGICFINRGKDNKINTVAPVDAINRIVSQTYIPKDHRALELTLGLIDDLLRNTPLFELDCDISKCAVRASFEAMTHKKFDCYVS